MSVTIPGEHPIVFDLGTGLRYFGHHVTADDPFQGSCLLSHLHWDHIQGLPFFTPLLVEGAEVDIYGPVQDEGDTLAGVFSDTICPPLFPVELEALPGTVRFHEVSDSSFTIGAADVISRVIPHVGTTVGYRLEWNGRSVAYLSDHQMPLDGSMSATEGALDLCRDVDLLIHDAQFTPDEFAQKRDWGHCTIEYAVWLAAEAGARRLALFHHDPSHGDAQLDVLSDEGAAMGERVGVEVFAAREGRTVAVGA